MLRLKNVIQRLIFVNDFDKLTMRSRCLWQVVQRKFLPEKYSFIIRVNDHFLHDVQFLFSCTFVKSMSRYNNKELIAGIKNGNEDVLVYLSGKYFQPARRMLRIKGIKDESTPEIFSTVLIKAWFNILHPKFPETVEFETFFFNLLDEHVLQSKATKRKNQVKPDDLFSGKQNEVAAKCVSILDENSRNLLHAHYAEHMSFEKIAVRFNYSNSVIAQHEVVKAMTQLEGIVKIRLNITLN
jgi:hypothetical protein